MSSAAFLQARLPLYIRLVRLDNPIGILLLLWPTLWALWAASDGWPQWHLIVIFSLGTALMRSAGCAMNDYFDRDFDLHVDRTQNRVLTTGQIRPAEALWVAAALALASLLLILPLNGLVWLLSLAAAFLAVTYPLMKRFFAIPQAYLGIAFGFGIPMGFAAVQYEVPAVAWLMLLANVAWSVAYDTEYALVDIQDDLKLGLKTSAITFGRYDLVMIGLCYAITLGLLAICGAMLGYGLAYGCGLLVAAGLAVRHLYWIRHRERSACFRAFLNNTWFGCVIFLGILAETSF